MCRGLRFVSWTDAVALMQNPDFWGKIEGLGLKIWTALAAHPFLAPLPVSSDETVLHLYVAFYLRQYVTNDRTQSPGHYGLIDGR